MLNYWYHVRVKDPGLRYACFKKMHSKPLEMDLEPLFGKDDAVLKF
jgi:hypothetical protein